MLTVSCTPYLKQNLSRLSTRLEIPKSVLEHQDGLQTDEQCEEGREEWKGVAQEENDFPNCPSSCLPKWSREFP